MGKKSKSINGFTLVEVMVVLVLLTLSFMVFLRALNTGKIVGNHLKKISLGKYKN